MKITFDEVKKATPKEKTNMDSFWAKIWPRELSYRVAAISLNYGIDANQISKLSIITVIIGCIMMSVNNRTLIIVGMILINLFILLDCVDGAMARATNKNSPAGEFIDGISGYSICAFSLLAVGICAYNTKYCMFKINDNLYLLILSSLGCICDILSRLIYQKYSTCKMIDDFRKGRNICRDNDEFYNPNKKNSLYMFILKIDREFGVGGLYSPLIIVAFFTKTLDIFVLLYSMYHIIGCMIIYILHIKKSEKM